MNTHRFELGFAALAADQQEAGLAGHGACQPSAVAFDEVLRLLPPQRVQHPRDNERLARQAVRVPSRGHLHVNLYIQKAAEAWLKHAAEHYAIACRS